MVFQKYMSSAVQNIAELLALLADNDSVRAVIVHPDPADDEMSWDLLVAETRFGGGTTNHAFVSQSNATVLSFPGLPLSAPPP